MQLGIVIAEGFVKDQLLLRAHSLTYLTMLSIVPFLALVATFADLIGMRERVVPLLTDQVAAAVPQAAEWLESFVRGLDFGALGPVSGGVLVASTVLALGGVERALNAIWGVRRQRPWSRRIPDYVAVLIVAPLLLGIAIPLRATLESQALVQRLLELPGFETLYAFGLSQTPTLLVVVAFSFLYWFLPNTDVRPVSALLGGAIAGLLFSFVQKLYLAFQVGAAKYNAIFGTFAAVPLFMVWAYFSWAIVLLGAEIAYAHQTLARYRREVRGAPAGPAAREAIGLAIALEVARAFRDARTPWTTEALSDALDVPLRTVRDIASELEAAGIVSACAGEGDPGIQLARPAEGISLEQVRVALRGPRQAPIRVTDVAQLVCQTFGEIDTESARGAGARTLGELLDALRPLPEPAPEVRAAAATRTEHAS